MYYIKISLITIGDTDEQEYAHQLLFVSVWEMYLFVAESMLHSYKPIGLVCLCKFDVSLFPWYWITYIESHQT